MQPGLGPAVEGNKQRLRQFLAGQGQHAGSGSQQLVGAVLQYMKTHFDRIAVQILQVNLNVKGFDCGTADGIAGRKTAGALERALDSGFDFLGLPHPQREVTDLLFKVTPEASLLILTVLMRRTDREMDTWEDGGRNALWCLVEAHGAARAVRAMDSQSVQQAGGIAAERSTVLPAVSISWAAAGPFISFGPKTPAAEPGAVSHGTFYIATREDYGPAVLVPAFIMLPTVQFTKAMYLQGASVGVRMSNPVEAACALELRSKLLAGERKTGMPGQSSFYLSPMIAAMSAAARRGRGRSAQPGIAARR